MRITRALGALLAALTVTALATFGAPTATAEPPLRLAGPVTDHAGVLSGAEGFAEIGQFPGRLLVAGR